VHPFRIALAVSAAALLGAACGGGDGSTPAGAAATSTVAAGTPAATPSGTADLPATEILARAKAALKSATSVRISGYAGAGSERTDLDLRYAGTSALGTLTIGGQRLDLRRIGQTVYIKGSPEFLKAQVPDVPAQLQGKWLKASLTEPRLADLTEPLDLGKTADVFLKPDGAVTKGERKSIAGTDAISLRSAGSGALWIAAAGKPYPLLLSSTEPKDPGRISFTDYDAGVSVTPPPAELTLDIDTLGN
jgi:hypothetical protein